MTFPEWSAREGAGALTKVMKETGLAWATVWFAAHPNKGKRPSYKTAKAISEATGGEVSIAELCEPEAFLEEA